MNIEELREYCIKKKHVTESFPFNDEVLVFKVHDKAFLLLWVSNENFEFNVKCDPEKVIELREQYPCVQPGYHMNKKYWNTIVADGSVEDRLLREWIDHSYELAFAKSSGHKKKKAVAIKKKK